MTRPVAAGVVLLILILVLYRTVGKISAREIAWLAGGRVPAGVEAEVYQAYLRRHNWGRLLGGALGVAVGVIVALRWGDDWSWTIQVGFGIPIHTNVLVWWLMGVTLGTLLTESYRLFARAAPVVRRAVLDTRPVRPLPRITWAARAVLGLAVLGGIAALALRDDVAGAMAGSVLALLYVGLAEATQAAITDRPRPVADPTARVDGRLRWFAGTSVAWLELAGAILGLTTVIGSWSTVWDQPRLVGAVPIWAPAVGALMTVLTLACVVVGIVAILRSRVHPPSGWHPPLGDGLSPGSGIVAATGEAA